MTDLADLVISFVQRSCVERQSQPRKTQGRLYERISERGMTQSLFNVQAP